MCFVVRDSTKQHETARNSTKRKHETQKHETARVLLCCRGAANASEMAVRDRFESDRRGRRGPALRGSMQMTSWRPASRNVGVQLQCDIACLRTEHPFLAGVTTHPHTHTRPPPIQLEHCSWRVVRVNSSPLRLDTMAYTFTVYLRCVRSPLGSVVSAKVHVGVRERGHIVYTTVQLH